MDNSRSTSSETPVSNDIGDNVETAPTICCLRLRKGWSFGPCYFPGRKRKLRPHIQAELQELVREHYETENPANTTLLHLACLGHYSDDLIKYLLRINEDSVFEENDDFELPLHYALKDERGASDEVIKRLLEIHPRAAECRNIDQNFPMHLHCEIGAPNTYAVQRLIDIYPNSLLIESRVSLPFEEEMKRYIEKNKEQLQDSNDSFCDNEVIIDSDRDLMPKKFKNGINKPFSMCSCFPGDASSSGISIDDLTTLPETNSNTVTVSERFENGFIPLHLAVLSGASPDVIECILNAKPNSLTYETNQGRTPMDCAKYIVRGRLSNDDHGNSQLIKNTFAAIEIMESIDRNIRKAMRARQTSLLTNQALTSMRNNLGTRGSLAITRSSYHSTSENNFDPGKEFQKFMISVSLAVMKSTLMGVPSERDNEEPVVPQDFTPPNHLQHHNIDIILPVGFRRLRWALLSNQSRFVREGFLRSRMKFSEIDDGKWDKCGDSIGLLETPEDVDEREFLNATKKRQYLMPRTGLIGENMAYEESCLLEYNDYCFVIKAKTKNPDVPYGDTFWTHTMAQYTNLGGGQTHMHASTEVEFEDKPPLIAWKIKAATYRGTTDFFAEQGEAICQHATD